MRSFLHNSEATFSEGGGDLPIKDRKGKLKRNKRILKPPQLPSSDVHTDDGGILHGNNKSLKELIEASNDLLNFKCAYQLL